MKSPSEMGQIEVLEYLSDLCSFNLKKKIKHKMSNYLDPKICDKHLGSV